MKYFNQLLDVHEGQDIEDIEVQAVEILFSEPHTLEVEIEI